MDVGSLNTTQHAVNTGFVRAQTRGAAAIAAIAETLKSDGENLDATQLSKNVIAVFQSQIAEAAIVMVEQAQSKNTKSLLDVLG